MINHNDHIDRRAMLEAERAALVGANEEADAWGAAVGARSERIKGIDRALLAIRTKETGS